MALYYWPWHWSLPLEETAPEFDDVGLRIREEDHTAVDSIDESTRLLRSLLLAATATVLRPTNVLIWATLASSMIFRPAVQDWLVRIPWTNQTAILRFSTFSLKPSRLECMALVKEGAFAGLVVLVSSLVTDRLFYQSWTFPPFNFLYFNVMQSLAVFYGNNDWHYYLSQGYPLLLTTALPFALIGIYHALSASDSFSHAGLSHITKSMLYEMAVVSLVVPAALSLIAHKEVRFIYPLLPALHILAAPSISTFFGPAVTKTTTHPKLGPPHRIMKRVVFGILLFLNVTIAIYTTTIHNSGLIHLTDYLRHQYETYYTHPSSATNMTVGFLMPCHSTPWRSHMQYPASRFQPGIEAWALTCEPPLHLSPAEKAAYLDEADQFYADPGIWLKKHMSRHAPVRPRHRTLPHRQLSQYHPHYDEVYPGKLPRKEWPDYLVFFEQLESVMRTNLRGGTAGYTECARFFNTHWHDDWRRQGDVVVMCLEEERAVAPTPPKFEQIRQLATRLYPRLANTRRGVAITWSWSEGANHPNPSGRTSSSTALGGGKGPFGVGLDVSHHKKKHDWRAAVAAATKPIKRVIEEPFWRFPPSLNMKIPPILDNFARQQTEWWNQILGLGSERWSRGDKKKRNTLWS